MKSMATSKMQTVAWHLEEVVKLVKAMELNNWIKAVIMLAKLSKTINRLTPVFSFLSMTTTAATLTTRVRAQMSRLAQM